MDRDAPSILVAEIRDDEHDAMKDAEKNKVLKRPEIRRIILPVDHNFQR